MTVSERTSIQELIRRYKVRWELFPAVTFVNHKKHQYGFELGLAGTCQRAEWSPPVTCRSKIYNAPSSIASSVLPQQPRATAFHISPFDREIHYRDERGGRPDVLLAITLAHNSGSSPVDEYERRCLRERTQDLEALAVTASAPPRITSTPVWRPAS